MLTKRERELNNNSCTTKYPIYIVCCRRLPCHSRVYRRACVGVVIRSFAIDLRKCMNTCLCLREFDMVLLLGYRSVSFNNFIVYWIIHQFYTLFVDFAAWMCAPVLSLYLALSLCAINPRWVCIVCAADLSNSHTKLFLLLSLLVSCCFLSNFLDANTHRESCDSGMHVTYTDTNKQTYSNTRPSQLSAMYVWHAHRRR